MIKRSEIHNIAREYSDLSIGTLGSHSALEIMDGAKDEKFHTIVVCQKGREAPYKRFSRLADKIIIVINSRKYYPQRFRQNYELLVQ